MRVIVALVLLALLGAADARADRLLRAPYITSTGETVDKPGRSKSAGTTHLDRRLRKQNNAIDHSICQGC